MNRALWAALFLAAAAGCAGGSASVSPGSRTTAAADATGRPATTAQLILRFPGRPAGRTRGPRFISPCGTQTVGVTAVPSGGSATEQLFPMPASSLLTVPVPVGTDTIRVATYGNAGSSCAPSPQATATGAPAAVLSVAATTVPIVADQSNVVTMVLLPFVSSVTVKSGGQSTITPLTRQVAAPSATTYPVTLTAYDAAGDLVTGAFANTIAITPNNTTHITGPTANVTGSGASLSVTWDQWGDSGGGLTASPATLATPAGMPTIAPALQPVTAAAFSIVPDYVVVASDKASNGYRMVTTFTAAVPAPTSTAIPTAYVFGMDTGGVVKGCPSGGVTVLIGGNGSGGATNLTAFRVVNGAIASSSTFESSIVASQIKITSGCIGLIGDQNTANIYQTVLTPSFAGTTAVALNVPSGCPSAPPYAPGRIGGFDVDPTSGAYYVDGYGTGGQAVYSSVGTPARCATGGSSGDSPIVAFSGGFLYYTGGAIKRYTQNLGTTTFATGLTTYPYAFRLSPDGQSLAYSETTGTLRLIDFTTGTLLAAVPNSFAADFSPDSTYLWTIDANTGNAGPFSAKAYNVAALRAGAVSAVKVIALPAFDQLGGLQYDTLRTGP